MSGAAGAASREPVVVEVESSISKVVVYNDRAQVTRKAEAEVTEGESKVVFTDLPLGINRDAIQVFVGEGVKCEMRGVTYKSPNAASLFNPETEKTEDFEKLEEEIRLSDEKMAVLTEKKNICENNLAMVNAITGLAVKEGPKWDVGKYQELLSFQRKHREDGQKEIRVLSDELVALRKVHADLLTRQQVEGMKASKPTAKIEVSVLCQSPGTLRLSLAYLVNGAGWKPHYDFRVDGATKEVNISYHGIVTQQTGESWEDVQVQLSTAKPNLGGKQPELNPWRISLQPSFQQAQNYAINDICMSNVMPMQQMMSTPSRASNMFVPPPPVAPGAPPAVTGSTVAGKSSSTSVIFKVAGTHTIPSTGDETRVSIAVETFPAHFRYSTVPKLSQHAFLKAKIVNSSEFPFLAGGGSVFLDNALVAPTEIDVVPPGQDFWLFLGVDEAIGIKIKFIKREDREEGSMVTGGKRNKTIISYQIRIKNNKRTREEIVVWDQLPIPDSKDITVKMVDPELNPENPHFKKDENEYVEWFFDLKPGQEVVQPFVYSVEAAKHVSIYGLEHLQ